MLERLRIDEAEELSTLAGVLGVDAVLTGLLQRSHSCGVRLAPHAGVQLIRHVLGMSSSCVFEPEYGDAARTQARTIAPRASPLEMIGVSQRRKMRKGPEQIWRLESRALPGPRSRGLDLQARHPPRGREQCARRMHAVGFGSTAS